MNLGVGLFLIMAHVVTGGDTKPTTLALKEYKLICTDVLYYYQNDGYKYAGFYMKNGRNYLTKYENSDILAQEVKSQCGK